ncbi:MAG: hypothetical protein ACAH59_10990 [Pseudobdellovibrionaceae bacterium]
MNLHELVQMSDEQRTQDWENQFFHALTEGKLKLISPEPQTGPDNWPYLLTETSEEATESTQKLIAWLSERGIGLAINPMKEYPDYVFSYGMLWSFRESGFFYKPIAERPIGAVQFETSKLVHAGPPTEEFLPGYVRKILRDFFRDQGILKPQILVISTDGVNYDLALSLESLGKPPDQEHQGIAEAISWFLPPHYSLMLISEEGLPPFSDL